MASISSSLIAGVLAAVLIQCFWHAIDAGKCTHFQECGHSMDCIDGYVCSHIRGLVPPSPQCRPKDDFYADRTLVESEDYVNSPEVCVIQGKCREGDACGWSRDCDGDLYCRRKQGLTKNDEFPGVCTHMGLKDQAPDKGKWKSTQAVTKTDFKTVGKEQGKGSNIEKCHKSIGRLVQDQLNKIQAS